MHARRLPRDDEACGWAALLPPLPPPRLLRGRQRVECAVVGAGFTGVAAARRLAEHRPDWRIAIVDAQRVGSGASGRNSGFVVDLPHYDGRRGLAHAQRLLRLGRAGRSSLRQLVETHGLRCDWHDGGRLHAAAGAPAVRALAAFLSGLDALGEPYERLDRTGLAAIIGSAYYGSGARTRASATVQPAALIRGLAATLPPSVELYECSPVCDLAVGDPCSVDSDAGSLIAPRVVLATNGYSAALGALRRQVLPLMTFGSLTRRLDDREAAALGGEAEWGLVSELPMGTTLRRVRGGRLLIRNSVRYTPRLGVTADAVARIRERHQRDLLARFPQLAGIALEHTWGGVMGASFNGAQFFGALAPTVFVAAGYNGVGIAMGTISGVLLADLIVGVGSALLADMTALPRPTLVPPEPLLGIGVRATLAQLARTAAGD